jgi:hypothetical protein
MGLIHNSDRLQLRQAEEELAVPKDLPRKQVLTVDQAAAVQVPMAHRVTLAQMLEVLDRKEIMAVSVEA